MSLDLKDYLIGGASGLGTTVILEGLLYAIGLYPTNIKKALGHGLINSGVVISILAVIDNVKPIKKEVQKELFPHMGHDDGDTCSF